jgi:hypothetical protein
MHPTYIKITRHMPHTNNTEKSEPRTFLNPKHSFINDITAPMLQKKKEGQCIIKVRRHR